MKNNQTGFGLFIIFIITAIVISAGTLSWYVYREYTQYRESAKEASNQLATLSGIVTRGPISPNSKGGGPNSVMVTDHALNALSDDGKIAASTKTDSRGKYTFRLLPGKYSLVLDPKIGMGTLNEYTIDVVQGDNNLNISVDTGIR